MAKPATPFTAVSSGGMELALYIGEMTKIKVDPKTGRVLSQVKELRVSDQDRRYSAWQEYLGKERLTCQQCDYSVCFAAIDFHHRNPKEKGFNIAAFLSNRACNEKNRKILEEELIKCDILCCRCHREVHWYTNHWKEETDGN